LQLPGLKAPDRKAISLMSWPLMSWQRPWLCPELLAGLQLELLIRISRADEHLEQIRAAWEDDTMDDHGRAEALFLAGELKKTAIWDWFVQHPRYPGEAMVEHLNVSFDELERRRRYFGMV
jgi:hypothetical protein